MIIEFKTVVENGEMFVEYTRDGMVVARGMRQRTLWQQ